MRPFSTELFSDVDRPLVHQASVSGRSHNKAGCEDADAIGASITSWAIQIAHAREVETRDRRDGANTLRCFRAVAPGDDADLLVKVKPGDKVAGRACCICPS